MYRISRKMAYAVEAVTDIAYFGSEGLVQSREVTSRQGIPERYLEQTLQQLVREGILNGVRGPRGGYKLARAAKDITVGEIVRIIRNAEQLNEKAMAATSDLARLVVRPMMSDLDEEMMHRLDAVTIQTLVDEANRRGIDFIPEQAGQDDHALAAE